MALVEIMKLWSEGVAAADKGDWSGALKSFTTITEPRAKICFNIGCCHLVTGNIQEAEKAFTSTVEKDKHLAVGYFQRGSVFFKEGKYNKALQDWLRCYTELRGNQLIDYKILGLTFKLYSCEVLYNIALGHTKVENWAKAEENLILALSQKVEPRHGTKIEKAMQEILKQKDFPLVEMPKGRLFQPNEKLVEQLEKKDYLGKAMVVASVVDKDSFSGFAPLKPQNDNPPPRQKTAEVLRTLQGEPHRVLFEFIPETSEEMEVMPGNIVFVLKKGEDNWATVLFNGKKGIVPYNYLEPVELKFQSKNQAAEPKEDKASTDGGTTKAEILAPPTASAPIIPLNHKDKQAPSSGGEKSSSAEKATAAEPTYLVKVYYKYTVAIQVSSKLSYGDLLILISSKLKLTLCSIMLSFRDGENDVPLTTENVEKAWALSTDNCLKLKCTDVHAEESHVLMENAENPVPSEEKAGISVTALFDYEASQPEDLPFKKGDVIKVLNKVVFWRICRLQAQTFPRLLFLFLYIFLI
ncbi:neutrophil cytosol factor 2 isoform X2 [Pyxicephalus adspersus]|uniref:neutrophil cytosol factor 2 isoform X2 n=1 Tax=Pyxicephalus adspersus TaxID=30357 RepID=UPI003B5C00A2